MSSNDIVNGDVFPKPRNVEGWLRVNCGLCGGHCTIFFSRDHKVSYENANNDDRPLIRLDYLLNHLWKCNDCGAGVDVRESESKIVQLYQRKFGPIR